MIEHGTEEFARSHVEACRESLANPKVRQVLGDRAIGLIRLTENLRWADCTSGLYEVCDQGVGSEYIPLIVPTHSERIGCDPGVFASMHPDQIQSLRDYLEAENIGEDTEDALQRYVGWVQRNVEKHLGTRKLSRSLLEGCAACVDYDYGKLRVRANDTHEPVTMYVATRPFVMINPEVEPGSGETLLHELVHVQQALRRPVLPKAFTKDWYTRLELEAYHVEFLAGRALGFRRRHNRGHRYVSKIEAMRVETRGESRDPYEVTPELRRLLKPRGYDFQFCPR